METPNTTRKYESLVTAAIAAKNDAHVPYGKKPVACAIDTDIGIFKGVTVENCAYPNSICAIKAGLVNAVSSGANKINSLALSGWRPAGMPSSPCGCCREFMSEFGNFRVVLHCNSEAGEPSSYVKTSVGELLPHIGLQVGTPAMADTEFTTGKRFMHTDKLEYGFTLDPSLAQNTNAEMVELMLAAIAACKNAYIPVSDFPVGAAVLTDKGRFEGANIESNVIGCGLCAERSTICKAISNGAKTVKALAVVCYKLDDFGRPCGGCRQSLVEWGRFPVYQIKLNQNTKTFSYELTDSLELLPNCFCPASLS